MRSRAPPGAPDEADDLPLLDALADLHVDLLHVSVERAHAVTVVERHVLAEPAVRAGHDDLPGSRRLDRRPRRAPDVDPAVPFRRPVPRRPPTPVPRLDRTFERPPQRERAHHLPVPADQLLEVPQARALLR